MARFQLFQNQLAAANLASANIDSIIQGDDNSMPFALQIVLDVTALTGTSIQVQPLLFDPVSQKKIAYGAAFAAIVGVSTNLYVIGSTGIGAASGGITGVLNAPVPSFWGVRLIPVAVTSITATCTAYTVPLIN